MDGEAPNNRKGPLYAAAPGACALVFEGFIWALAAMSGDNEISVLGFIGLVIAVVFGLLMPVVIVSTRQRDAWGWAIVSLVLSSFGIFIGLMFCLQALLVGCSGECFG